MSVSTVSASQLSSQEILKTLSEGGSLSPSAASRLLSEGMGVEALSEALRRIGPAFMEGPGGSDLPILFSNLCEMGIPVYDFPMALSDPRVRIYSVEDIEACLEVGRMMQAKQATLSGRFWSGLQIPGLESLDTLKTYRRLVSFVRERISDCELLGFSTEEIEFLHVISGRSHAYILDMLRDAGLDRLSGLGSEMLSDAVRQKLSPKLLPVSRWLEITELAFERGMGPMLWSAFGHVDGLADRAAHLQALRGLMRRRPSEPVTVLLQPVPETGRWKAMGLTPVSSAEVFRFLAAARLFLSDAPQTLLPPFLPDALTFNLQGSMALLREGMANAQAWGAAASGSLSALAYLHVLKFGQELPLSYWPEAREALKIDPAG